MENGKKFDEFCSVMDTLLGENGCPWDREQTHKSLKGGFLEECYETVDAIDHGSAAELCEELGDVLLHIVLQGKIGEKEKEFTVADIIDGVSKKMVHRHPHVFGEIKSATVNEIHMNWDIMKQQEKQYRNQTDKMQRIPKAFPALMRASKVQKYAEKAGHESEDIDCAFDKIHEQIEELRKAVKDKNEGVFDEYGELLFKITGISRIIGLNPEFALTNAVEKFINRSGCEENASFSQVESRLSDKSNKHLYEW